MIDDPENSQFVALLTEHQTALRYYVGSLMPGDSHVADVTQQANSTIWKKRDDFELGTNFKAWIFSIARFEVLNYRKRQARDAKRLVFSDEMEAVFAEEIPLRDDELEAKQEALRGCLTKLRPAEQELIQQRYFEKTGLDEFAATLGRSAGSLRVSLHRIRGRLAKCIESKLNLETV